MNYRFVIPMKFWGYRCILSEIYDMAKNQKFSEL